MASHEVIETRLLSFLQKLCDDCINDIPLLKFDKRNHQQLYVICTYATIVEIAFGCFALVESSQLTTLPTLLRSLLEAYADFVGCLRDPNYYKYMYTSLLNEKLRLLKKTLSNPHNPYLKGIAQSVDIVDTKSALEAEIAALKCEGHEKLDVSERFAKAGLEGEYQTMYWLLCLHAHNNISALEDRHIEKQGDDYNVVMFKEVEPADRIRYFDALGAVLIDSSSKVHQLLESEGASRYEQHVERFNEIRNGYSQSE